MRQQHRTTRARIAVCGLVTVGALVASVLGAPVASADDSTPEWTPLPWTTTATGTTVPSLGVDSGSLGSVLGLVGTDIYIDRPPQVVVPDIESLRGLPGVVMGAVVDAQGKAVEGATIVINLLKIKHQGTDPTTGLPQDMDALTTVVTNAAGQFLANVPTTEALLEEAEYLNGQVNLWVDGSKTVLGENSAALMAGGGAHYSALHDFGPDLGGIAMAPVNIGVLTLAAEVDGMTGALPAAPADDPESTQDVDRPDLPLGAGAAIDTLPVVGVDLIEVPDEFANTYVATPLPEPDFSDVEDNGGSGDDGTHELCSKPANQGNQWHVRIKKHEMRWQPVGEVHGWLGTHTKYTYSQKGATFLTAALNFSGKGWKLSGGTTVSNDAGAQTSLPWLEGETARKVEGEFKHIYVRETKCPEGYRPDYYEATHRERVYAASWSGGLRYGAYTTGDGWDAYRRARDEGRAMTFYQSSTFAKTAGKTYTYEVGVSAFGVGLRATTTNSVNHKMTIKSGTRLKDWHLFGNKDVPAEPVNNAIYVSG